MNNSLALRIGGFAALLSTSLLGSTTVAHAGNVGGCGAKPAGGTLKNISGVCELRFDSDGTYEWTLPDGIAELYSVLVGAGGGADSGYAGAGGDVEYADLTEWLPGDIATVVVGSGGDSVPGAALDGDGTTLSMNGEKPIGVFGGANGDASSFGWGWCLHSGAFGENLGAGDAGPSPEGSDCVGGGPGLVPDSDPDAPAIFEGFTTELGHGGGVYINRSHKSRIGEGANVFITEDLIFESSNDRGADGAVIFRYSADADNNVPGSGNNSRELLAATGGTLPVAVGALASIAVIAAGVGVRPFGRRRSRASR